VWCMVVLQTINKIVTVAPVELSLRPSKLVVPSPSKLPASYRCCSQASYFLVNTCVSPSAPVPGVVGASGPVGAKGPLVGRVLALRSQFHVAAHSRRTHTHREREREGERESEKKRERNRSRRLVGQNYE